MERMTNCPNCGAPARGLECAYCGTMFETCGLVEHEQTALYSDGEVCFVIDNPRPSEELLGMVARGIVSVAEMRRMVYG